MLLGIAVGLVVTLLMLAGLQFFVPLQWDRFGLWLLAILAGGGALAAAGAALGAAAREVRAVSLLAFMVTLPVAFLSLIPSGAVGGGVFDLIEIVTALFPFKPALEAMTAALDSAGPSIGGPLIHLAILIAAYGLLARLALALRRCLRPSVVVLAAESLRLRVGSGDARALHRRRGRRPRAARAARGDAGAARAARART